MKTSNQILKNYELDDIKNVLKSENIVVRGGGRYIKIENRWVTPDSVASRIKTLSKNIPSKEEGSLKEVVEKFIAVDAKGYSKLDKAMRQATPFDRALMKSARFFKTLFSRPEQKRHEMLHSLTPIENAIKTRDKKIAILNGKPDNQLKIYYAKVLETSSSRIKSLEGYSQSGALQSYLQDLNDYRNEYIKLHQPVPKKLDEAIKELQFAYKISLAENLSNKEEGRELIIHQIRGKIKDLAPGSSLLIPGGSDDHAVMYKVEKAKNGSFSFTIINTGEGADVNILNSLWTFTTKGRLTVQDVVYTNLKMDQFSEKFISSLMTHKFENMEETNKFLEKSFKTNNWHYGRKHKGQLKGSCAFKNVSTTLHEKMGDTEYNRFKTFVTERELRKLQNLAVPPHLKKTKANMISEGKSLLEHRSGK